LRSAKYYGRFHTRIARKQHDLFFLKNKTITPYFIENYGWIGVEVALSICVSSISSFIIIIIFLLYFVISKQTKKSLSNKSNRGKRGWGLNLSNRDTWIKSQNYN
jgi:hypothetical protein